MTKKSSVKKIILNYIIHQNINVPFHLWDFENSFTNYSKYICMKYIFPVAYNVNFKKAIFPNLSIGNYTINHISP